MRKAPHGTAPRRGDRRALRLPGCHSQLAAGALSKDLTSAFKSTKIHVKKDGSVSINNTDTSEDSAALADGVALLSALADKP